MGLDPNKTAITKFYKPIIIPRNLQAGQTVAFQVCACLSDGLNDSLVLSTFMVTSIPKSPKLSTEKGSTVKRCKEDDTVAIPPVQKPPLNKKAKTSAAKKSNQEDEKERWCLLR